MSRELGNRGPTTVGGQGGGRAPWHLTLRTLGSVDPWLVVVLLVVGIYLLPIWTVAHYPTQDGPSHVYNARVLQALAEGDRWYGEYFAVRAEPIPNWFFSATMLLLLELVSPFVAEKVFLSVYVVLMAGAVLLLVDGVEPGRRPLVLLALPFIYNVALALGFYNYCFGVALLLLVLALWLRWGRELLGWQAAILGGLLVVLHFCHPIPLALAVLLVVGHSLVDRVAGRCSPRSFGLAVASTLPSSALTLSFLGGRAVASEAGPWGPGRLWQYFVHNGSLVSHGTVQVALADIIAALVLVFGVLTVVAEFTGPGGRSAGALWRPKDVLAVGALVVAACYALAPDGLSGGGFVKARLAFLPLLLLIPWLSWRMSRWARGVVGTVLVLVALAWAVQTTLIHRRLDDELAVATSGVAAVERRSTLLPLIFERTGSSFRAATFLHLAGYYGVAADSVDLANYEAHSDHFPTVTRAPAQGLDLAVVEGSPCKVDFARHAADVDYLVTWGLPRASACESRIRAHYDPVHEHGKLVVFRRRASLDDHRPEPRA